MKSWVAITLIIGFAINARAQIQCSSVFSEEHSHPIVVLQNQLKGLEMRDWRSYQAKALSITSEIAQILKEQGIETRYYDANYTGLFILPTGNRPIAKVARGLARMGIRVQYSPNALNKTGSLGAYDSARKTLFVDAKTLITGEIGPVAAHEIRHAFGDWLAQKKENIFERLFQTSMTARDGHLLPGGEGPYGRSFSFDEILAHRQSAANFLARLKNSKRNIAELEFDFRNLIAHGNRFNQFIRVWKATSPIFESEVAQNSVAFSKPTYDHNPPKYQNLTLTIVEPTWINKKLFRKTEQNPEVVGLRMSLMFSEKEIAVIETQKKEGQELIQNRLRDLNDIILALEEPAKEFERAMERDDLQLIETTLREIHRILAVYRQQYKSKKEF